MLSGLQDAFGANAYILLWNSVKVDVKGSILWTNRSLIRVEEPLTFPKYLSWKYDSAKSELTIEKLRIRRTDGRVELLALDVKEYGEFVEKRANLENLKPGDIIDISFSFRRESPLPPYFWWYFPNCGEMDIKKLHLEVTSPGGFVSNESLSSGLLEREDIYAIDPFSPPKEPILLTSLPSWDRAYPLFSIPEGNFPIAELERRLSKVPGSRGKVELIWKILSERKKVLEGWAFSDQGYRFSPLKEIWERDKVTPSDFSFLAYHMLKGIGLSPEMVWVSEWPLSEKYPVPSLLKYPILKVVVEDKTYWLDPYALGLPAGYIHPKFQGGKGVIFYSNGAKFVDLPVMGENLSSENIDLVIDLYPNGSYDFSVNAIARGWLVPQLDRLRQFEGVSDVSFENKGYALIGKLKGKGKIVMDGFERKLVITLPQIGFPLDFLSLSLRRSYPINLGFLRSFDHQIILRYPKEWKVKALPLPLSRDEGAFSISARFSSGIRNRLTLSYSFKLKKRVLSPEEWASLIKVLSTLEDYIKGHILFEGK